MRIETTDTSVQLVEFYSDLGQWAVRWDFKPKLDENGQETGVYWYEEEIYNWIPTIDDIQQTITDWFNKQTDGMIQHGFEWKGIKVLLNDENKFNYKAITQTKLHVEKLLLLYGIRNIQNWQERIT